MTAKDPRLDVIAKAVKDPAFRAELKKDPKAAIEKATGVKVPAGLTVKVVEDSASTVHLILPASSALSEKELGKVAGGASGTWTQPGCCPDLSTQTPANCQ